jgi:hypothetical protein
MSWIYVALGDPHSSDSEVGREPVVLALIAAVVLLLIGLQRVFRGQR